MNKKKLLVSFSSGRTSAKMAWWIKNNLSHKYDIVNVFSNVGKEKEESLIFADKVDKFFGLNLVWIEPVINPGMGNGTTHKLIDFNTANRKGKPFEDMIAKYGIPGPEFKHCSRELKGQAIRSYARSIGWTEYETAIGIRTDEPARLKWDKAREENLIYFAQLTHVTKSDVNLFWSKQPFDLELKSYEGNCDLCWKKGLRKLMTITKAEPALADWWREMERKYELFTPESRIHNAKPPYRFYRDHMTIDDIIEESAFPFDPAKDESKDIDMFKQQVLFDKYLDSNDGCVESCEAF